MTTGMDKILSEYGEQQTNTKTRCNTRCKVNQLLVRRAKASALAACLPLRLLVSDSEIIQSIEITFRGIYSTNYTSVTLYNHENYSVKQKR